MKKSIIDRLEDIRRIMRQQPEPLLGQTDWKRVSNWLKEIIDELEMESTNERSSK